MAAYYDNIARKYKKSKTLPFREYVEWYSYRRLLGDLTGKTVLDLACGDGFYSRRIKLAGAADVLGIDISEKMIELAQEIEAREALGINYKIGDALKIGKIGRFDLVVASYLLNYAQTREQLLNMCRTIAANLKPRGRFVSINNNPSQPPKTFPMCKKYGFIKQIIGQLKEGTVIRYEFYRTGQEFQIDNYYLSREIHDWAFKTAGLTQIHWRKVEVDPQGISKFGEEYWQEFLEHEPIIGIECRR
jgi:2-polyprenyl-3-methyl-5-hydroxy-6-metoxy-1,4-benzoquinol methylase